MNEDQEKDKPEIHVDEDWKAEARAEKDKLSDEAEKAKQEAGEGGEGRIPPASFSSMVNTIMMQTLMAMGGMEDPETKKRVVDLDLARYHIDTLGILQEKTKGNLTDDEEKHLERILHELRMNFLGFAEKVQEAMQEQAAEQAEDQEEKK